MSQKLAVLLEYIYRLNRQAVIALLDDSSIRIYGAINISFCYANIMLDLFVCLLCF